MASVNIQWMDFGKEPQCAPDPKYPNGIDLDLSGGSAASCRMDLPYPARRCGAYFVECLTCGQTFTVTTAGRPDDPKSMKVSCILTKPGH